MIVKSRWFVWSLSCLSAIAIAIAPTSAPAELLYYTTGSSVRTWNSTSGANSAVSAYTERLGSIAFDVSGQLYAVAPDSGSIVRLTVSGSWQTVVAGLEFQPQALTLYGMGEFLYVSRGSGVITRINQFGSYIELATLPEMITGLACDIDGSIFATGGKKVFRVSATGTYSTVADFSAAGWPTNRLYGIGGITRANNGVMYVVRQGETGVVYTLDGQGGWQFIGGHRDGLISARQVAVDDSANVNVLHTWSPFAGGSQISSLTTGASLGYSGFQVGGVAFPSAAVPSAAVPEPDSLSLCLFGAGAGLAVWIRHRSKR